MRLDLFLKRACLLKQRSEAKRACDNGIVSIDGQPGKASRNVAAGQRVSIAFTDQYLEVEILSLPLRNVSKAGAKSLYRVVRDEVRDVVDF
jgi:ribosomal 50S subunit-recycling heat shock protein